MCVTAAKVNSIKKQNETKNHTHAQTKKYYWNAEN